ncbi:MAG: SpoIIE family protein phosphatase [Spirochaetales bacterium]
MNKFFSPIARSFRRKLILFNLVAVFFTAIALFSYMMLNFSTITQFSLAQNSQSMESTVEDYLQKLTREKAESTGLALQAAQDNLTVVGKMAQSLIDNGEALRANRALLDLPLFATPLESRHGALTSRATDAVDTLIPPALVADPAARRALETSALLNLGLKPAFEANRNNAFLYFVGVPPVTRAYPNIDLAEVMGEGLNALFWKDFFAENVAHWTRWYTDKALQKTSPNPVTMESPYIDAAGQGMMVTMFYPLWDAKKKAFAGAVAADITLSKIIENTLSIKLAKTGFAFLMNGQGNIIAMPENGYKHYQVNLTETKQGSLSYYSGSLSDSKLDSVKKMAETLLIGRTQEQGLLKLDLDGDPATPDGNIVVWANLPALNDRAYGQDSWKILISVPETEIFEALNATHQAISQESLSMSLISILILVAFLILISYVSFKVADRTTRDLQLLAEAAKQVSVKNYDISTNLTSLDEIGQLGRVFDGMTRDIKDYTIHLESKVEERTADLVKANEQITELNARLKGENLRLGAELDVARRLQMMVLPGAGEISSIPGLDIACYMRPADEVGGDYYDILRFGDTAFIGIGDVTGHGLSAGVIMLMAQTALMTLSHSGETDISQIMNVLNRVLYNNILRIREDKNMTLSVLQYRNDVFTVVGQHESVLVCRVDGSVEEVNTMDLGLPVGLEEDIRSFIGTEQITLRKGDTMVLYTDGVTEAVNRSEVQYSLEGLKVSLARHHSLPAAEQLDRINADLVAYIDGSKIHDDISVVVIKKE